MNASTVVWISRQFLMCELLTTFVNACHQFSTTELDVTSTVPDVSREAEALSGVQLHPLTKPQALGLPHHE